MLRLKKERKDRGWTITELSYQSKIHPSNLGKLESGKLYPYNAFKKKLSDVFNIPGDDLFKEVLEVTEHESK